MRRHKQMRKKWIKFLTLFSLYSAKKKLQQKDSIVPPFYNLVNRSQKFVFSKYLQFLIIISAVFFDGCTASEKIVDLPCNDNNIAKVLNLSCSPSIIEVGQPCSISAQYQICNDYFGKFSRLGIQGPLNGSSAVTIIDTTIPFNTQFYTEYFSHTFTQPGNYIIWFSISKTYNNLQNPDTNFRKELNVTVVGIEMNNFKIIELSSTGDSLWQNYNSGGVTYNAGQELNTAFNEAYTRINFIDHKKNLTIPDSFPNITKLYDWTINNAGGTFPGTQPYGLDPNVVIIAGTKNIADKTTAPDTLEPNVTGFNFPRVENQMPALCWIRVDRLREIFPNPNEKYDFIRSLSGTSIHELGHARGIPSSEHGYHSGTNADKCVMRTDRNIDWDTNPRFCDYHKNKIKIIVW